MKGMFKTLRSFEKITDFPLYSLDYTADYSRCFKVSLKNV